MVEPNTAPDRSRYRRYPGFARHLDLSVGPFSRPWQVFQHLSVAEHIALAQALWDSIPCQPRSPLSDAKQSELEKPGRRGRRPA